jgi:hypothetical protein
MSREEVASALDRAAEALAEAAHALRGSEPDAARASVPAAEGSAPQPSAPAASPLGVCPTHRIGWTVKEGGISKNGKPYKAFWKCSQRDANGYCDEKPDKSWANTHDPEEALMDEPF